MLFVLVLFGSISFVAAQEKVSNDVTNIRPDHIKPSIESPVDWPSVDCPSFGIPEGEPCGSDLNGGCNMGTPAFTPVSLGQLICGNTWLDGGLRDTDWFELNLAAGETVTMTLFCNAALTDFGFAEQTVPGVPGCGNITWTLNPFATAPANTETSVVIPIAGPGTYYFFVGINWSSATIPCPGADYTVSFTSSGNPLPGVPLSTIGIGIVALFMVVFSYFKFWRGR
ncbi:MAG: hypothetical protein KAG99_02460 [Bacteroidales bacterium]|nr:hypothetical protein [Bacteroidales bacterium]